MQVVMLALASHSLFAQTHAVAVPFVGCPSEGQLGPEEAPKGTSVSVATSREGVLQLAYYSFLPPTGVLAPRGWHCFGILGSGGGTLFITPELIDYPAAVAIIQSRLAGNAVVFNSTYGGGSGSDRVARVIARVFPKYKWFVNGVRKGYDLPSEVFPSGPYPADKLVYRSPRLVEFRTPAHADGLGTDSWFKQGDEPINGVAILVGDDPDLRMLSVRLPPGLTNLTTTIVHQMELDAKRSPRK